MIPILVALAGVGGTAWLADKTGILDLEDAGEEIGEVVGKVFAGVVSAIPEVIEETGPAVVDGLSGSVAATREALRGKERDFIMVGTIIILSITGWWALKSMFPPSGMDVRNFYNP